MSLFALRQAQDVADEISLVGACQLNDRNCLGQMNDLTARSRQLVFSSRRNYVLSDADDYLHQLTGQILEEDREHAQELEKESRRLKTAQVDQATKAIVVAFEKKSQYAVLPGLVVKNPRIDSIRFGSIAATQSNVSALKGIEELALYDKSRSFEPTGTLYRGNIDAKLPGEDSDLHFYLSSLPAPVSDTITPARLLHSSKFVPILGSYCPSATSVAISMQLGLSTSIFPVARTTFTAASTAAGPGAAPVR